MMNMFSIVTNITSQFKRRKLFVSFVSLSIHLSNSPITWFLFLSGCSIFENCKRCNNGTWGPRDDFFITGKYCAECRPGWSGGDCMSTYLHSPKQQILHDSSLRFSFDQGKVFFPSLVIYSHLGQLCQLGRLPYALGVFRQELNDKSESTIETLIKLFNM